jgi:hypothetical protein
MQMIKKEWDAALYRDGVIVGGVCSVQQQPMRFKDNISAGEGVCLFFSTFPRIRETRGVQYIRRSFFCTVYYFRVNRQLSHGSVSKRNILMSLLSLVKMEWYRRACDHYIHNTLNISQILPPGIGKCELTLSRRVGFLSALERETRAQACII